MNDDIRIAILSLLAGPGTSWNWYKLDRALSAQGLGGKCNIAEIALSLSGDGLLLVATGDNQAMPTYTITDVGRKWLKGRA